MPTEKQLTEVRRQQIVDAALDVIGQHGVSGLNIARIAHRVGFVPSAIYRHFNGKEAVLDSVLDRIQSQLIGNVQAARKGTKDALRVLRRLLRRHLALLRENAAIPLLVFSDQVYAGHPDRKLKMRRILQCYLDHISEVIRTGQETRAIRADLDPGTMAVMFLGLIQPAAILWHLDSRSFDLARHTGRVWRVFEEMLQGARSSVFVLSK